MPGRSYRSPVRADAARRTRGLVVDAARKLFLDQGYGSTSVAQIARVAGVSGQTVYNVFGTKADLLKQVYDVTLVGDDEPVPFAQRPEVRALMLIEDPAELLHAYCAVGSVLLSRLGPLLRVVTEGAATGQPDLVGLLAVTGAERLLGVTGMVGRLRELGPLRDGVDADEARDVLWSLTSLELWQLLVGQRGWSRERYTDWLGRTAADTLLPQR